MSLYIIQMVAVIMTQLLKLRQTSELIMMLKDILFELLIFFSTFGLVFMLLFLIGTQLDTDLFVEDSPPFKVF